MTRSEHAALCDEVKRLIALGELFEVNLAHVLDVPWEHDGFALFERLVAASPGDHSAYLEAGGAAIASVSPELFLRIEGDRCETRPIKGTRRRGATPEEDARARAELNASVKDRAENVMIVDLLRNDLVPTSVPGSVQVTQLCEIERTASVMHLVSSVVAARAARRAASRRARLVLPGRLDHRRAEAPRDGDHRPPRARAARLLLRLGVRVRAGLRSA